MFYKSYTESNCAIYINPVSSEGKANDRIRNEEEKLKKEQEKLCIMYEEYGGWYGDEFDSIYDNWIQILDRNEIVDPDEILSDFSEYRFINKYKK